MDARRKILFIVNPVSGPRRNENKIALIREHCDKYIFDIHIAETKYKGHARDLALEAKEEAFDTVVAFGGDGTVNETAQPLVGSNIKFGIIPGGSGNGFAMHIGMGRNRIKAIQKLNTATSQIIDTCSVNDQFFLNLAGTGFDALIAFKAENNQQRGLQMYVQLVSQEIMNFKAENFLVELGDEKIEGHFTSIAIANASMYGYNFSVAPKAELSDGLLDVVFIKEASVLRTLSSSWRMLNKSIDKSRLVKVKKVNAVSIETDKPYYYHVDGESFKFNHKLNFKLNPKSLNVLFPL